MTRSSNGVTCDVTQWFWRHEMTVRRWRLVVWRQFHVQCCFCTYIRQTQVITQCIAIGGHKPPFRIPCQWQGRTKPPGHNPIELEHNVRCRFLLQERGFWKLNFRIGRRKPPDITPWFRTPLSGVYVRQFWNLACKSVILWVLSDLATNGGLWPGGYVRSPSIAYSNTSNQGRGDFKARFPLTELTARVDGWPVYYPSTRAVLTCAVFTSR